MSIVHRTCFDVYQRRPFFSTAIQSHWIAIKPIQRIIIPAFEPIYMYFISRIWKNKSVNFRMCMSQKKWKRKFGFSVPMSIKKTFEIYDDSDCLFLIMLACPNEKFINLSRAFHAFLFSFLWIYIVSCVWFCKYEKFRIPTTHTIRCRWI